MPDFYGNPIPGVDTVYDYFGNIVAPTAAQAQAINAAYNQSQVSGTPMPSHQEIGSVITPDVSAADYAAYVNASYQQAQITQPQGTGVTQLSNGIYVDAQGNQIGTGPTYITTLQGIATIPEANSITEQIAQNIALFGTAQPGIQTVQKPETLGTNPSYLAAAGAFLSQQGAKKAAAVTTTQSQSQGQAAQIALDIAKSGGVVDPYLAAKAAKQGYTVPTTQIGSTEAARSTVPIRDITSGMADVKYLSSQASKTIGFAYTPYGGQAQTELKDVKIGYSAPGEVGFYQQPSPGRNIYNLVGGGGRAALQSGMFSINEPLTPVVYTQESGGTKFASSANIAEALKVIAEPSKYSRQGSEVYGGKVSLLTGATVKSTGAQLSTYASPFNLANLVNPYDVNKGKAELPGANIPWSVPASAPAIASFDTILLPVPFVSTAKGQVAKATTAKTAETAATSGVLPSPFVSGTIQKPTGEVGIPFTDVAFTIPVVSDVLKFFESPAFISGRASEVREVKYSAEGGADYTRMFITPEGPSRTLTRDVGEPRTETAIDPFTGQTITQTTHDRETITLPESRTLAKFEATPLKSGYEQMLDKEFRSRIPSVEAGEKALATSQLINPFSTTESAPAILGREIVFRGAGLVGIDTTAPRENVEFVKSWTSPTKGQYEFFYENPLMSAVSWGTMAVGGGAARGVVGALGKTERGAALIARATPIFTRYGGPVLGGLYGGMISYEETDKFREITPQTVARVKSRAYQEGIPGAVGFGIGYYSPEIGTSAVRAGGRAVMAGGERIFEMRQRSAGIERIEPGTITEYYDVMPSSPARPVEAPTLQTLRSKSKIPSSEFPISEKFPSVPEGHTRIGHVTTARPELIKSVTESGLRVNPESYNLMHTSVDLTGQGPYPVNRFENPTATPETWLQAAKDTYLNKHIGARMLGDYSRFGEDILLFDVKPEAYSLTTTGKTPFYTGKGTYVGRVTRSELETGITNRPSKAQAMEYIQQRYPEQSAIWEKYMTDVQMVPARKVPRPEEISTPKEAQAYLQSIQPKGVKVTSDMLAGERPRLKLEKVGEGTYRQTESGYIIPAGTTLTTGEGVPVSFRSLYYSSVIEPQFKGVREQTYGVPLKEQPAYKEASPSERRQMREDERKSIAAAEKAYRGGVGGSGKPTGSVKSPSTGRRGERSEVGFSVSSGIGGGQGMMLSMPTIREMSGAIYSPRQKQMQALEEEEAYLSSVESFRIPKEMTRPSPSQSVSLASEQTAMSAQQSEPFGVARQSQEQSLSLAQKQKQSLGVLSSSKAQTMQVSKQIQKQSLESKQMQGQLRIPTLARIQTPGLASRSDQDLARASSQRVSPATAQVTRQQQRTITETPQITITRPITTTTPLTRPTITTTPPSPFIPSLPTSSGGSGGAGQRFRSFRETLRIGEGVRWIDINGRKQIPYRAPVARSEPAKGKTSTASKRKRGLRF